MSRIPAPIDKLPNETLDAILGIAVKEYVVKGPIEFRSIPRNMSADAPIIQPPLSLLGLTHFSLVCRRWRKSILENGALWAAAIDIDNYPLHCVEKLVERAKACSLSISSINKQNPYEGRLFVQNLHSDTWKYVFANMGRLGNFALQTSLTDDRHGVLAEALKQPMPNLKSFTLYNKIISDPFTLDTYGTPVILPDKAFVNANQLKIFVTNNVYLPVKFDFALWENLTVLSIHQDINHAHATRLSTAGWLNILAPMAQLEHLELKGMFSGTDVHLSSVKFFELKNIQLDHLSILKLETEEEREVMFDVFAKLVIPYTCKVLLTIMDKTPNNPYPIFALDRFKLGLDRRMKGLEDAMERPHVYLEKSALGEIFTFIITIQYPKLVHNFQLLQQACFRYWEDERLGQVPALPHALDDLFQAFLIYNNYPIPRFLEAIADVRPYELTFRDWAYIVAEDTDPLLRFLSNCDRVEKVSFKGDTDPVIFEVLMQKKKVTAFNELCNSSTLLPNLKVLGSTCLSEEFAITKGAFVEWWNSQEDTGSITLA